MNEPFVKETLRISDIISEKGETITQVMIKNDHGWHVKEFNRVDDLEAYLGFVTHHLITIKKAQESLDDKFKK